MKTLANVKPNWRDNPPTYANMCDKSTMEWNLTEEIKDVTDELQNLVEISENTYAKLVNGLKYKRIKTWEDMAEILVSWLHEMEEKMEPITDRFCY